MEKVTYALEEEAAHELIAALQAHDYGAVMAPALPGQNERHVVVTVPDGGEQGVRQVVDRVAPQATRMPDSGL